LSGEARSDGNGGSRGLHGEGRRPCGRVGGYETLGGYPEGRRGRSGRFVSVSVDAVIGERSWVDPGMVVGVVGELGSPWWFTMNPGVAL